VVKVRPFSNVTPHHNRIFKRTAKKVVSMAGRGIDDGTQPSVVDVKLSKTGMLKFVRVRAFFFGLWTLDPPSKIKKEHIPNLNCYSDPLIPFALLIYLKLYQQHSTNNTMSSDAASEVPYYLMPVAALCGIYSLLATIKALHQVYKNLTFNAETSTGVPPASLKSKEFITLLISTIISIFTYGYVCAQINNSITSADIFDPFEILNIQSSANTTQVKSAYRSLSLTHHPDKGGDTATFQKINLAYKALSDAISKSNWEQYGHPDGPQTQTLSFALPEWLLHPEGNVAIVLLLMYFAMFALIIYSVVKLVTKTEHESKKSMSDNSVAQSDLTYLAKHLRPDSTHLDVLYYVATCPESIEITQQAIDKGDELKVARIEFLNPSKKSQQQETFDFGNDEGWANDDEDDDATKAAKAKQAEKEKLAKQVAEASGKDQIAKNIKIEGLDDGVLGQVWVEKTLENAGQWPPKFGKSCSISKMTFAQKGSKHAVSVLEHRAARRNLCMTLGRLNSQKLNSHSELSKLIYVWFLYDVSPLISRPKILTPLFAN